MLKDEKTSIKNENETEIETVTGTVTDAVTDIVTDAVTDSADDTARVNMVPCDDIEAADGAVSYDSSAKKLIANMAVLDFETAMSWSYESFEFVNKLDKEKHRELSRHLYEVLSKVTRLPASDWHRLGFEQILRIEIHEYGSDIELKTEVELGQRPPRTDYMLLYKSPGVRMSKGIFRIFRGINVIEYKSPVDHFNETVIYKTIGYAYYFIGAAEHSGDVPMDDVTASIFAWDMDEKLRERVGELLIPDSVTKGVYLVKGIAGIPVQVVIGKELEGDEYAAYRALTNRERAAEEDIEIMLKDADREKDPAVQDHYRIITDLISNQNPKTMKKFMEGRNDMGDVLMEILRPELDKREKAAREEGKKEGREEGKKEGKKEGREDLLVRLICTKLRKKKDIKTIAEELEVEESRIKNICEIAEEFASEYDAEKVLEKLREKKEAA